MELRGLARAAHSLVILLCSSCQAPSVGEATGNDASCVTDMVCDASSSGEEGGARDDGGDVTARMDGEDDPTVDARVNEGSVLDGRADVDTVKDADGDALRGDTSVGSDAALDGDPSDAALDAPLDTDVSSQDVRCGHASGEICCSSAEACTSPLSCAGTHCTCVTACFAAHNYNNNAYVLRSDGTAWWYGGSTAWLSDPVVVTDASQAPVGGFNKISTSDRFSCGIKADKSAWCWVPPHPPLDGGGVPPAPYGQLGNGTTAGSDWPVQVRKADGTPLVDVTDVAMTSEFACAVTVDHGVYCWGNNNRGELGVGTIDIGGDAAPTQSYSPYALPVVTTVGGSTPFVGADQIATANNTTCTRNTDGGVWCWGLNDGGQLGVDPSALTQSTVPVRIGGLANPAAQVALGPALVCARAGGEVWCWGQGSVGTMSTIPIRVVGDGGTPFDGISDLRAGGYLLCALKGADRTIWCWNSPNMSSTTPVAMSVDLVPATHVYYWDVSWTTPCFGREDGNVYLGESKARIPVACP